MEIKTEKKYIYIITSKTGELNSRMKSIKESIVN